jgi:hypothetical protein
MTYYDHQVGRFEPPTLPDEHQVLIARARRARAEATAAMFKALYRGLKRVAAGIAAFFCYAGYGAAKLPPQGRGHGTHAPLTGACK